MTKLFSNMTGIICTSTVAYNHLIGRKLLYLRQSLVENQPLVKSWYDDWDLQVYVSPEEKGETLVFEEALSILVLYTRKVNHKTGKISNLLAEGSLKKGVSREVSYPAMSSDWKIL